jgi:hypothetical protein
MEFVAIMPTVFVGSGQIVMGRMLLSMLVIYGSYGMALFVDEHRSARDGLEEACTPPP